jgi:hypothetical protein
MGSTVGSLVIAPAHAEFVPSDAQGTLTVVHDVAAVRAPVALGQPPAPPPVAPVFAVGPVTKPDAAAPSPAPAGAPVIRPQSQPAAPPPAQPDPNAAANLAAAVRSCVRVAAPPNVTVVVNTTLHLDLDNDGAVHGARFEPPVAPDVNACAAGAIYKARFAHGGSVDVPVDVTVPSSAP